MGFGRIGAPELILILAIALVIFGPSKLPEIGKSLGKALSDFKGHANKITEDLSALRERANVSQEEFTAKIGDQMTKTMYVLAILSTIFLPLNFIASLLGVNVSGIPGASNPNAFLIVCIIVIIIGIIEYLWFKKNRYF